MPDYRRNRVAGGTYFFTANVLNRASNLPVSRIEVLRAAVRTTRAQAPFHIDAWVVLPDHMHCIWTLPSDDDDYSGRWRALKKAFSKAMPAIEHRSSARVRRAERGIWQRRFWEHTIRDERDYAAHMDYVHFNPVRHGLATSAAGWPYSTFHRCQAMGLYPADWAGGQMTVEGGERRQWSGRVAKTSGGEFRRRMALRLSVLRRWDVGFRVVRDWGDRPVF